MLLMCAWEWRDSCITGWMTPLLTSSEATNRGATQENQLLPTLAFLLRKTCNADTPDNNTYIVTILFNVKKHAYKLCTHLYFSNDIDIYKLPTFTSHVPFKTDILAEYYAEECNECNSCRYSPYYRALAGSTTWVAHAPPAAIEQSVGF